MVKYLAQDEAQHQRQGLNPDIQEQRARVQYKKDLEEYNAEVARVNAENEATLQQAENEWHLQHDNTKTIEERFKALNDLITSTNQANEAKNEETLKKAESEYHITVTPNETQEQRFDAVNKFIDSLNQKNEARYEEMKKYGVFSKADVQWKYVPTITLGQEWANATPQARQAEYNRRIAPYKEAMEYNNKMQQLFGGKENVTAPNVGRLSKTASDILNGKSSYNPKQASPLLKAQVEAYQSYNQYLKGGISQSQYYNKQNEVNLLLHPQADYVYKKEKPESAAPKFQSAKYQQLVKSGASGGQLNREMYHTNQFVGTEEQWKALTYAEDKQIREARIKSAGYRKQGNLEIQQKVASEQQRLNNFKSASETLQLKTKNVPVAAVPWAPTGLDANAPKPVDKVWVKRTNGKETLVSIAIANKLIERGQATILNKGTFQGPVQQKEIQGPQQPFKGPYGNLAYSYGESQPVPVKGPVGNLEHTFGSKPLSPTGQVLEPIMKGIANTQAELQSTQAGKVVNALVGAPLGVAKDILTGIASLDVLGTQTVAPLVTGKSPLVRETQVPDTSLGLLIQGGMEGKQGSELLKQQKEYVQKYGAAGAVGEYSTFLIGGNPVKGLTKLTKSGIETIYHPSGEVAGKTAKIFEKPIVSKVGGKIFKGEIKAGKNIPVPEITRPFEIMQGTKAQSKFTQSTVEELASKGKLNPKEVELQKVVLRMEQRARLSSNKITNPGGSSQGVEHLTPKQAPVMQQAIKDLQSPQIIKKINEVNPKIIEAIPPKELEPFGQIGGSYARNRQLVEPFNKVVPGDIDWVMEGRTQDIITQKSQVGAKYFAEKLNTVAEREQVFEVGGPNLNKVESIRAGKKEGKIAELLDTKDIAPANIEAISGGKYIGRTLSGKGLKDPITKERLEKLSESQTKTATSILTLQPKETVMKDLTKWHGETPPPKVSTKYEYSVQPPLRRVEKDLISGLRVYQSSAIDLQKTPRYNPATLVKRPKHLGREQAKDVETYKRLVNELHPGIDWSKDYPEEAVISSSRAPSFRQSLASRSKTPEIKQSSYAVSKASLTSQAPSSVSPRSISDSPSPVISSRESYSSRSFASRRSVSSRGSPTSRSSVSNRSFSSRGSPVSMSSPKSLSSSGSIGSPKSPGSFGSKSPASPSSIASKPSPVSPSSLGSPRSIGSPGSVGSPGSKGPPPSPGITGPPPSPGSFGGKGGGGGGTIWHPTRRPPPPVLWAEIKSTTDVKPEKPKPRADFLGSAFEASLTGLAKRGDITYGRSRTARITAKDTRMITKGKAWSLARGKSRMSTWTKPPEKVYQKFTGGSITGRKAFKKGLLF